MLLFHAGTLHVCPHGRRGPPPRDIVGGRAGSYEKVLKEARHDAIQEMQAEAQKLGANAVVGVDLDYEVIGDTGSMLMVSASGTAVKI